MNFRTSRTRLGRRPRGRGRRLRRVPHRTQVGGERSSPLLPLRGHAYQAASGDGDVLRFGLTRFAQSNADWYERAQRAERCGFDVLWAPDHLFHFQRPDEPLLDGWVTLAAWAAITTRIRLGTLITNLSWRSPVLIARATAAIDQISGGRFELGIGAGAFDDQAMAGVLEMPPRERVARLAEGAVVIDRLLRGDVTPFAGRFTQYQVASMAPGCLQVPRPPITIAANGDGALRVAARYADVWNTWGGLELPIDQFFEETVARSRRLDDYCANIGRDPSTVRRSLLVYPRFVDPWADEVTAEALVKRFHEVGFTEFVFGWPPEHRVAVFEHFVEEVMPRLRNLPAPPPAS
jgi:alkanesulfonate monooxygenase SsuD/methylene tetrahydromethanopterin reductase-like flavin-dependent oxidoreductase (luciferase family)